jgi:GNAT superfamily N-acetyltransferase
VQLVIRAAGPGDLPDVERITDAAFGPYIERIGDRPVPMDEDYAALIGAGAVRVAVQDGVVVGHCVLLPQPGHLLLDVVAVDPAWRGRGVGGRLIAHAEEVAASGHGRIELYTHRLMTENIELYRHLGYREVTASPPDPIPRVHFVKVLSAGR